jgi:hypothetical protein
VSTAVAGGSLAGLASTWTPEARERPYPNTGHDWRWFQVIPDQTPSTDPRAGVVGRHHLDQSAFRKAGKVAATAMGIHKPVSVQALRHPT